MPRTYVYRSYQHETPGDMLARIKDYIADAEGKGEAAFGYARAVGAVQAWLGSLTEVQACAQCGALPGGVTDYSLRNYCGSACRRKAERKRDREIERAMSKATETTQPVLRGGN